MQNNQEAIEVIDSLFAADDVEIVHLTPQLFDRAYALYKQYEDKAWGLIDCVSFVVMRDSVMQRVLRLKNIQNCCSSLIRSNSLKRNGLNAWSHWHRSGTKQ